MRRLLLTLGLFIAALAVTPALARTPKGVPAEAQLRIRTIGVVSAIGDEVHIVHYGFTVFGNKESWLPVPEWKIDDQVFKLVEAQLAPRYVARRIPVDASWYARPRRGFFRDTSWDELKARVAALPRDGVDAYLVIVKALGSDDMDSLDTLTGLSTFERHLFGQPYAFYQLSVWDAASRQPLAVRYGRPASDKWALFGMPGAGKPVYEFPDTAEEAARSDTTMMQFLITRELKRSLGKELFEIGLGSPPPKAP